MPTILVVDDAQSDREIAQKFLTREAGFEVWHATDGADALAKMEQAVPDLVITDLEMPYVDGLQLVATLRQSYPLIPVILMTSRGDAQVAAAALHEGAASYVPKRMLALDLLDTVRNVLEVSRHGQKQTPLFDRVTQLQCTIVLENDRQLIAPLVRYLQEEVVRLGLCDQAESIRIGIALEEGLTNAVYHGNLEVNSSVREQDDRSFQELIDLRSKQEPFCTRRVFLNVALSRDEGQFVLRDEGRGFDPSALLDPTDPANLDNVCGRGVLLMRTFMDEVIYNEAGNQVTLIKRRHISLKTD